MTDHIDRLLKGWWPWAVAILGVALLVTNKSPDGTDYGFYGWMMGFPFVVEYQKAKNRRSENGA